jgi:single-strand selective monofunctional uracil DNA glycosylase
MPVARRRVKTEAGVWSAPASESFPTLPGVAQPGLRRGHSLPGSAMKTSRSLREISRTLCTRVARLRFAEPVAYTYNPLAYAREPHEAYLERYGQGRKRFVLLGMNPGPFGMAQTGVPFGDVGMVRDWLGIDGKVERPEPEHPRRPVLGFACSRREISGSRLWGWAQQRFETPEHFFERFFVVNYCPLAFLEASGKNRTPDRLPPAERDALLAVCDAALHELIALLGPEQVIGVGGFAERRAKEALQGSGVAISGILHPSPASPLANRNWAASIEAQLRAAGIDLPG